MPPTSQKLELESSGVEFIKQCCKIFSGYGATKMYASYDGSGDSGDFNGVTITVHISPAAYDESVRMTTNPGNVTSNTRVYVLERWTADMAKLPNSLITENMADRIEDELFSLLPSGWEINDGSYGEFTVDVATGEITLDHNERYTEVRSETFKY